MPLISSERRAQEIKAALANFNDARGLLALQETRNARLIQLFDSLLENLTPKLVVDEAVVYSDGQGTLRIEDPLLISCLRTEQLLKQRRIGPSLPVETGDVPLKKRGRKPIPGRQQTRAAVNLLSSVNISLAQIRRHALNAGKIEEDALLPDEMIGYMADRNHLRLPDGRIPSAIYDKLRQGQRLEEIDLLELVAAQEASGDDTQTPEQTE